MSVCWRNDELNLAGLLGGNVEFDPQITSRLLWVDQEGQKRLLNDECRARRFNFFIGFSRRFEGRHVDNLASYEGFNLQFSLPGFELHHCLFLTRHNSQGFGRWSHLSHLIDLAKFFGEKNKRILKSEAQSRARRASSKPERKFALKRSRNQHKMAAKNVDLL